MNAHPSRTAISEAMDRLIAGNPLRSDGKLTVKSLAIEADVPRHHLTEIHTDLKDEFYARIRNADEQPPALVGERLRREAAERDAERWRERALSAEAGSDELIRALHVMVQSRGRETRMKTRLLPFPD